MKKTLFLLFFALSIGAKSQNNTSAKIQEGPIMEESRASITGLLGSDNDYFYITKIVRGDYYISKVDKEMKEVASGKIDDLKYNDKRRTVSFFVFVKNKIFMFSSFNDKKEDKFMLFVEPIDMKSLTVTGKPVLVNETKYEKRRDIGAFRMSVSKDESKVLIFTKNPETGEMGSDYSMQMFDDKLNLLWKKEDELKIDGKYFVFEQYYADNEGNVHIVGIEFPDRKSLKRSRGVTPNYKYHIFSFMNKGNEFKDYEVVLDQKFITDMRMEVSDKGEIIFAGFYSHKPSNNAAGTFYLSIDSKSRQIKNKSLKDFSFEFVTEGTRNSSKNRAKKKEDNGTEAELYSYELRDLIIRADGGAVLLAEQYYMVQSCYTDPKTGATRCTYHYYYNDVIVVSINPEGAIDWNTRVRKLQYTSNDGGYYSSFASAVVGDKIYLVFNDNPKNLLPTADLNAKVERFGRGKEIAVTLVTIDPKGTHKREMLFAQSKRSGVLIRPKISEQFDNECLILMGERGKKYQYFTIKF